jgi:YesN/AraC family two-component response regulator
VVTNTIRVVIADDEYLVREGARSVLSAVPGFEVVGTASGPDPLMALIDETQPDAVLLDVRMPPTYRTEGIDAALCIRSLHPRIGVVILSQYAEKATRPVRGPRKPARPQPVCVAGPTKP